LTTARGGLIRVYFEHGLSEAILLQGQEAVRTAPEGDTAALITLAESFVLGGLSAEAIPLLERIVETDPQNEAASWWLFLAKSWTLDHEGALSHGAAHTARFGEDSEVHLFIGVSHQHLGRLEEALRHYEQAKRLLGDDATARAVDAYIGTALIQLGRPDEARELLLAVLDDAKALFDAQPDNIRIASSCAFFCAVLGDPECFHGTERRILQATSHQGMVQLLLAWGATALGDLEHAADLRRRSLESGCFAPAPWEMLTKPFGVSLEDDDDYGAYIRQLEARKEQLRRRYVSEGVNDGI
jgi:tetratricopeptide (TPR) repeat protein